MFVQGLLHDKLLVTSPKANVDNVVIDCEWYQHLLVGRYGVWLEGTGGRVEGKGHSREGFDAHAECFLFENTPAALSNPCLVMRDVRVSRSASRACSVGVLVAVVFQVGFQLLLSWVLFYSVYVERGGERADRSGPQGTAWTLSLVCVKKTRCNFAV